MVRPVLGLGQPTGKIFTDSLDTAWNKRLTRRAGRRRTRAERQ
jgi:hypothetical protein